MYINQLIYVEHLEQHLVHSKYLVNVGYYYHSLLPICATLVSYILLVIVAYFSNEPKNNLIITYF